LLRQRYYFYSTLGGIGLLCSFCQWLMFRHGVEELQGTVGFVLFLLLPLAFVLPNTMEEHLPVPVSRVLAWIGGYCFVFIFYGTMLLLPFFFIWAILNLVGCGAWWGTAAAVYAKGALFLLGMLLPVGWYKASHPVVREITLVTKKVKGQGLLVAFASDIHLGMVLGKNFARKLVRDMNALKPDLVILGGDIIDGNLSFVLKDGSFHGLAGIEAKYGAFAVLGNHDHYGQDVEGEKKELAEQGIRCLLGETVMLENVQVTAMKDALFYPRDKLPMPVAGKFSILVEHEPVRIEEAERLGYDLYLAGHTHAGQFWPIRRFTRKMFFLDYGTSKFGNMTAVVSSGYGAWGMLFRLQVSPEIVLIRLKPESESVEDV